MGVIMVIKINVCYYHVNEREVNSQPSLKIDSRVDPELLTWAASALKTELQPSGNQQSSQFSIYCRRSKYVSLKNEKNSG